MERKNERGKNKKYPDKNAKWRKRKKEKIRKSEKKKTEKRSKTNQAYKKTESI